MRNKAIIITLVLVVLGVIAFVIFHHSPKPVVVAPAPVATTTPWLVQSVIGKSVQGRDIEAYTFGDGAHHLVFAGGMHGGYEWNSVLLAYQLIDYLSANQSQIAKDLTVTVIPAINPDGVFLVTGKVGRFTVADVSTDTATLAAGRFNANKVDLNRNFACNWAPTSSWQNKTVSAGTAAFSEPEAQTIRDYALKYKPDAFVFWHSQANAVYASQCNKGILPETLSIMDAYAKAGGYPAVKTFDAYPITGDSADWLSTIGIPAITVELKTHDTTEWDKNLAGIEALFNYFSIKN